MSALVATAQVGKRYHPSSAPAPTKEAEPTAAAKPFPYTDAVRANNVGVALMNRRQFAEALGKFQTACVLDPESDTGCLNAGIALLNMRRYDDARNMLAKSAERDPQNPRSWFNLALLERAAGNSEAAMADFQKVAALDPNDAGTQYFLGFLDSQAEHYQQAAADFRRAIELDPFHASAEYDLAQAEAHLGDADGAKAHLLRFQHITERGLGKPIRFLYGEQGQYSLAQEMSAPLTDAAPTAISVHFLDVSGALGVQKASKNATTSERFHSSRSKQIEPESAPQNLASFLGSGACVFDYDGDGRPDIFLVNANGSGAAALLRNAGRGKFVDVTKAAKLVFVAEGTGCAVGDYDNDGHPDLVVSSAAGITLFHNEGDGTFKDATDAAGVRTIGLALGVTFIDYDGDGDLDLYVTRFNNFPLENPSQPFTFPEDATPTGNVLWRNAGNGTFVDATKETALRGSAPSVGALGTDLTNDGAADLVVTGWAKSPAVLLNTREGPFRPVTPWAAEMPGPTAGAVALDFDGDGLMDLAFTQWAPPGLSLWRNVRGKSFEHVALPDPGWMRGWGLAAVDYDNDGLVDLVAVGETFSGNGRILLLRNEGQAGFRDVTHETGLDKIVLRNPRSVVAFDADGDGSIDLLITKNGLSPVLLKSVGGNKNNWLQLVVAGDTANKMGIGTRAEVFFGARKQIFEVPGASGYLGQGPPEIFSGLGDEGAADVLRLFWSPSTVQDEIQVPNGKRNTIVERDNSEVSR
ncbi:MAG: FG-GAP-like repeat-containing protein [Candidatus Acidiferrales bacterium]